MSGKVLAIIPARGGSKRIPRKNIKPFMGKPVIAYSIDAALKSGIFDIVMVSTDDQEIADTAKACGAEVPFLRSPENSGDYAGTNDVLFEVLDKYEAEYPVEWACCIYPCAPFLEAEMLRNAFATLRSGRFDSVFPVVRYSTPVQRAYRMDDGKLSMLFPGHMFARSQDLEPAYYDAGQFYFFNVASFKREAKILTENTSGIIVPQESAHDIDTEEDWRMAELKYKISKGIIS